MGFREISVAILNDLIRWKDDYSESKKAKLIS